MPDISSRHVDARADGSDRPAAERDAQQQYDFIYREMTNRMDPMNVIPQKVFGMEEAQWMLDRRGGLVQTAADRGKWRRSG